MPLDQVPAGQAVNYSDQELWLRIAAEFREEKTYGIKLSAWAESKAKTASPIRPPLVDYAIQITYAEDGSVIYHRPDGTEDLIFPATWLKEDHFMYDPRFGGARTRARNFTERSARPNIRAKNERQSSPAESDSRPTRQVNPKTPSVYAATDAKKNPPPAAVS